MSRIISPEMPLPWVATQVMISRSWVSMAKAMRTTSPFQQGISRPSDAQRWLVADASQSGAMAPTKPEDIARGQAAEARFQAWLEASRFPCFYIDQTMATFARHLRGNLKQPGFFVGIRGVGLLGSKRRQRPSTEARYCSTSQRRAASPILAN